MRVVVRISDYGSQAGERIEGNEKAPALSAGEASRSFVAG